MHARWWNAAGLLIVGLLGIGAVVSSGAIAETKHDKPPPKRAVQHPRVAPRSFAVQHRGLPSQQPNVGNRIRQGNFVRPGIGAALGPRGNGTGLRAFGSGARNPTAAPKGSQT